MPEIGSGELGTDAVARTDRATHTTVHQRWVLPQEWLPLPPPRTEGFCLAQVLSVTALWFKTYGGHAWLVKLYGKKLEREVIFQLRTRVQDSVSWWQEGGLDLGGKLFFHRSAQIAR